MSLKHEPVGREIALDLTNLDSHVVVGLINAGQLDPEDYWAVYASKRDDLNVLRALARSPQIPADLVEELLSFPLSILTLDVLAVHVETLTVQQLEELLKRDTNPYAVSATWKALCCTTDKAKQDFLFDNLQSESDNKLYCLKAAKVMGLRNLDGVQINEIYQKLCRIEGGISERKFEFNEVILGIARHTNTPPEILRQLYDEPLDITDSHITQIINCLAINPGTPTETLVKISGFNSDTGDFFAADVPTSNFALTNPGFPVAIARTNLDKLDEALLNQFGWNVWDFVIAPAIDRLTAGLRMHPDLAKEDLGRALSQAIAILPLQQKHFNVAQLRARKLYAARIQSSVIAHPNADVDLLLEGMQTCPELAISTRFALLESPRLTAELLELATGLPEGGRLILGSDDAVRFYALLMNFKGTPAEILEYYAREENVSVLVKGRVRVDGVEKPIFQAIYEHPNATPVIRTLLETRIRTFRVGELNTSTGEEYGAGIELARKVAEETLALLAGTGEE